tara:strand:+ start:301 stop:450 length:150 start_codon:yes stop_codon:yes gene_type:complete
MMNQHRIHILSATIRFLSEFFYLFRAVLAVMHPSRVLFSFSLELFALFL